jgi:hypothetical protein
MPVITQTQVIIDWIVGLGWDNTEETGAPVVPGPYIQTMPDKIVHITGGGGPGYLDEGALDSNLFQARVRGPADDPFAAEALATLLDSMIFSARFPATVDGVTIVHVHRLGGGPSPLPLDPSDKRYELTCNYMLITGV